MSFSSHHAIKIILSLYNLKTTKQEEEEENLYKLRGMG